MKILLAVAIVLFGSIAVFAQEVPIDKAEYDRVMSRSLQATKGKSIRTINESVRESSYGNTTTKIVSERIGAAVHTIIETNSVSLKTKAESIFINGKRFTKNADNTWKLEPPLAGPAAVNQLRQVSDETIYKSLGSGNLNGKPVAIYRTIATKKLLNEGNGDLLGNIIDTTFYFDDSGVMLRNDTTIEYTITPNSDATSTVVRKETKSIIKGTQVFEIDPTIKIEEPMIQ